MTVAMGRTAMLHGITAGASLILPPSSELPELWSVIETESPTWMHASAGFLTLLARFLRGNPDLPPPTSFRFARVTAAPISADVCEDLERRLGAPILPAYSSSEVGAVATALPPPAIRKPGSAGQPIQEMKIADEDGNEVGPGKDGGIWVRATRGFAGYLDDPETNAAVIAPGGWFRTGDVGYLDEDGFLFLTGRVNELINRGGSKISPTEVDEALLAHPAVREAATFAVPDERLGEDIVAAVVIEEGQTPTPRELRSWMHDRLATHKVPRRIWFVDALPRTRSGKPLRGALAERFGQDQGFSSAG
jgi:acyl-CoA synthetase (AMP-forming)/AMP-acid ligase II